MIQMILETMSRHSRDRIIYFSTMRLNLIVRRPDPVPCNKLYIPIPPKKSLILSLSSLSPSARSPSKMPIPSKVASPVVISSDDGPHSPDVFSIWSSPASHVALAHHPAPAHHVSLGNLGLTRSNFSSSGVHRASGSGSTLASLSAPVAAAVPTSFIHGVEAEIVRLREEYATSQAENAEL